MLAQEPQDPAAHPTYHLRPIGTNQTPTPRTAVAALLLLARRAYAPSAEAWLSQRAFDHLSIHALPIITAHVQDAPFPDVLGVAASGAVVDLTDGAHTQMSRLELELVLMEEGAPPDWMRPEVAAAHCSVSALGLPPPCGARPQLCLCRAPRPAMARSGGTAAGCR